MLTCYQSPHIVLTNSTQHAFSSELKGKLSYLKGHKIIIFKGDLTEVRGYIEKLHNLVTPFAQFN